MWKRYSYKLSIGKYYYIDGSKYEGEWRDDKKNGKGKLYV